MTTIQEALSNLENIKKYSDESIIRTLSPDEKRIQSTDTPLIKRLKKAISPDKVSKETQTELTIKDIQQMEQDSKDLKASIKDNIALTTYNEEAKLRLQELDNTLKTYEQTKTYLQNEAEKDKGLINELKEQVKNKSLTEEQLMVKIRELEKKLKKPLMVTVATETELTMADIAEMEGTKLSVVNFLNKSNLIKNEYKKRDIYFKLDVVERGIASMEEDVEHNKTQGQEMKRQLDALYQEVRIGQITETELNKKVNNLEQQVKRKETEYQKSLKVKDEQ